MESRLKREFHYFVLTEYEQEEKYLRDMSKQGYRFVKVSLPGFYYFERCEAEDMIYKLDFHQLSNQNLDDYIQMYKDYGWEYIQSMNDYRYFRRKASSVDNEKDLEIFSDHESQIDMLNRIVKNKMLPITIIFFLCIIPQFFNVFSVKTVGVFDITLDILLIVLLIFYVFIIGRCYLGLYRLKNKYNKE